jgi:hypothetical protein
MLVVAVLIAAGFTAWWVYERQPGAKTASTADTLPGSTTTSPSGVSSASAVNKSPVATNVAAAPQVTSTADLDSALRTIDQTDPSAQNNSDTAQLNSSTSGF